MLEIKASNEWHLGVVYGRLFELWLAVDAVSGTVKRIGEAIRGNGIALSSVALLQSELTAGRLVRLTKDVLRTDSGYYLCNSKSAPLINEAQRLADFLIAAAKDQNPLSR
jgi:hypothetical protein